jgi:predicted NBD/HSP70 family sugar kinase
VAPANAGIREHNLHALLAVLRAQRPASRADVVDRTGLSTPTVSAGLRAFEAAGLVREYGRTTGRRGPRASLYDLVPDAVLVLGIDVGARYVRTVVAGLDGEAVQEFSDPLAQARAADVLACVRSIPERLGSARGRVELAVAGSPGVVDPATGRIESAPNIEGWEGMLAADALAEALGHPVHVDNDVNLAVLGEQARGAGAGVENFGYLWVGSGLGAGVVLDGRLHRGARGAAGEVGFFPVGADPFEATLPPRRGAMERRLSAAGVAAAAARLAGATPSTRLRPPFDAESVFEAARAGDPLGRAVALDTARQIAVCVAGMTAVLDLELMLLGGGIGASVELLLPDVRAAVAELVPAPPRIEIATLAGRGTLAGAVAVGLDAADRLVIGRIARGERARAA